MRVVGLSAEQRERQRQRIEDCRELYLKYGGENHELIEREMRAMGHHDFHRRCLYRRYERGRCDTGWIERYGWDRLVKDAEARRLLSVPPAVAGGLTEISTDSDYTESLAASPSCYGELHNARLHPPATAGGTDPQIDYSLPFDAFQEWLQSRAPSMQWDFRHQVYLYKRLRKVFEGVIKRLMVFMPPRHGKSELVTKHFAAYFLKHNPDKKVIIGCYNQQLANKFSRGIKNIHLQDAFLSVPPAVAGGFPVFEAPEASDGEATAVRSRIADAAGCTLSSNYQLSTINSQLAFRPKNSEAEWETPEGGGVRAVGVGAGITGYGGNLIIIDDPIKSRAEANSATYRDRVYDWFNDDLTTRLEPDGSIILIQTRWHEDDLAGRLLKQMNEEGGEQWEVVNLPALAEAEKEKRRGGEEERVDPADASPHPLFPSSPLLPTDPLGRAPGQALWPERFDEQKLEKLKRQLGSYSFAALYQQTPVPAEGGLFKRAWFRTVPHLPPNLKKKRGWDFAVSKNAGADYTASAGVAYDKDGNMYIYDVIRRRIEYPEQRKLILGRIKQEDDTEHGIEKSANGNAVIQDLRKERSVLGRAIRGVDPKGDKFTRALGWMALAEAGCVFLVRGAWNQEFIDEACSFPLGTHDDQVDAVSIAVQLHQDQKHIAMGC